MKSLKTYLLAAAAVLLPAISHAFPDGPVTLIVPYNPGGSSDVVTRVLAEGLERQLGSTVVVKNVAGAGGALGWREARDAEPDGHTFALWVDSLAVMEVTKAADLKSSDFTAACQFGEVPLTIFANSEKGPKSLAKLKEMSDARPGAVGIGMGYGTPAQFAAAIARNELTDTLQLVNIGGGANKKAAVLGGHIASAIEPVPGVRAQHESGELNIIAVLSDERLAGLDAPTAQEQGIDLTVSLSYGLIAPKGTPSEAIDAVCGAVSGLADDAEFQERLSGIDVSWRYGASGDWAGRLSEITSATADVGRSLGFE
jgi:tripartite-type tricarboxylate transporter receptor subunit TctC